MTRPNKYHAKKCEFNGYGFDSQMERDRYIFLLELEREKKIFHLKLQPEFEILPTFVDGFGKKHTALTYTPDFLYLLADGTAVVEEVKGMDTTASILRRKMFAYSHRLVRLVVIKKGDLTWIPS